MVSFLLGAAGLLCWPPSSSRLARASPSVSVAGPRRKQPIAAARLAALPVVGCAVAAWTAHGIAVGLAALMVSTTLTLLLRSEWTRRLEQQALHDLLGATRVLAREVTSGTSGVDAVLVSAAAHRGRSADMLEALAVGIASDRGRGEGALGLRNEPGSVPEITRRLISSWSLSARYGVPWASLIEAVSVDLAERVRANSLRSAQVAGPRVSGYVLAVMPLLGVLLGWGMGANPVHVLLGTGIGHLLLMIGCALICAGLSWTARIVR